MATNRRKSSDPKLYQAAKPQLVTVLITVVVVAAVGYAIVKITHAASKSSITNSVAPAGQ